MNTQPRAPMGTPEGGQFAATSRPDAAADVTLVPMNSDGSHGSIYFPERLHSADEHLQWWSTVPVPDEVLQTAMDDYSNSRVVTINSIVGKWEAHRSSPGGARRSTRHARRSRRNSTISDTPSGSNGFLRSWTVSLCATPCACTWPGPTGTPCPPKNRPSSNKPRSPSATSPAPPPKSPPTTPCPDSLPVIPKHSPAYPTTMPRCSSSWPSSAPRSKHSDADPRPITPATSPNTATPPSRSTLRCAGRRPDRPSARRRR